MGRWFHASGGPWSARLVAEAVLDRAVRRVLEYEIARAACSSTRISRKRSPFTAAEYPRLGACAAVHRAAPHPAARRESAAPRRRHRAKCGCVCSSSAIIHRRSAQEQASRCSPGFGPRCRAVRCALRRAVRSAAVKQRASRRRRGFRRKATSSYSCSAAPPAGFAGRRPLTVQRCDRPAPACKWTAARASYVRPRAAGARGSAGRGGFRSGQAGRDRHNLRPAACGAGCRGKSSALLWAFYPGPWGGQAVAEVLTGAAEPSGCLPVSIPRATGQLPVYYNARIHDPMRYATCRMRRSTRSALAALCGRGGKRVLRRYDLGGGAAGGRNAFGALHGAQYRRSACVGDGAALYRRGFPAASCGASRSSRRLKDVPYTRQNA